jgi:septal ring factor EnvC (AmiA/AmiB activator)
VAGFTPQQGEDTGIRDAFAMRQMGATISPKKMDRALKPYRLEDAKVKGKSDTDLYRTAETAVIKWWQRQQRSKINANDNMSKSQQKAKLNYVGNRVERALNRIPDINEMAQARAEERAREARQQMNAMLRGTGLRGVTPPTYAMTSVSNLQAWINRQVHRRSAYRQSRLNYLG